MKEILIVVTKLSEDKGIYYLARENDLNTKLFLEGDQAEYTRIEPELEMSIIEDWYNNRLLIYEQPIFSWHIARVKVEHSSN